MKFSVLLASALALCVAARPSRRDDDDDDDDTCKGKGKGKRNANFELQGYGRHNPIGPTTGGAGGETVIVTTQDQLRAAVAGNTPRIVYAKGTFNLTSRLQVGSNKSLIGAGAGATILNKGITVNAQQNVIIRNLAIRKIIDNDALTIQNTTRAWIDHNDLSSEFNLKLGPDYYDGLCDIIKGSDWITVSWNYFHDHWKASLVGNSDAVRDIDFGKLHITFHHNYWKNLGTRGPAVRFGSTHVFNNFYEDFHYQAIHSRSDNQVLVEGNVFVGDTRTALSTYGLVIPEDSPNTSPDGDFEIDGYANLGSANDFGRSDVNLTHIGTFTKVNYPYKLTALPQVKDTVKLGAGNGKIAQAYTNVLLE